MIYKLNIIFVMNIVRERIFESPDRVDIETGNSLYWHQGNHIVITFGWYEGKLYYEIAPNVEELSRDYTHANLTNKIKDKSAKKDFEGRSDFDYPGRMWVRDKIISFWEFPDEYTMKSLISELSHELHIDMLNDDEWKIDIIPSHKKINPNDYDNEEDYKKAINYQKSSLGFENGWKLMPLSKYTGGGRVPRSELLKQHELSPLKKGNKIVPPGIGSNSNKKKPLPYKQAMYTESIKNIYDKTIY